MTAAENACVFCNVRGWCGGPDGRCGCECHVPTAPSDAVTALINEVWAELRTAKIAYPAFASAHEGYAVLLEEVEELWDEVRKKPDAVSRTRMRREAIQIAAMALRFALDVCVEKGK